MVSTAFVLPPAHDPEQLASILSVEERTFVALVCEIGPMAADQYFAVTLQYALPIGLVVQCRAGFAKVASDYLVGAQQSRQEATRLQELIPRLGKSQDTWLAKQYGLTQAVVRSLRLHQGIKSFDYSVQIPIGELEVNTDKALADMYGVPTYLVKQERRRIGLQQKVDLGEPLKVGAQARKEIMPDLVSRLGTATDTQLADQFGLTGNQVFVLRRHLGISKFSPYEKLAKDNPELVARLGTVRDSTLASEFGMSYETVNGLRNYLGIDKVSMDGGARAATPEVIEMFKQVSLNEMATRTGKTTKALRKMRKALGIPHFKPASLFTEEVIKALGTAPDPVIAERFGIDRTHLSRTRFKLGIKPYAQVGRPPAPLPAELVALLGKIPDTQIAQRFGMTSTNVRQKRVARGIPAFNSQAGTPVEPEPHNALQC
jgi:hypothetical protein